MLQLQSRQQLRMVLEEIGVVMQVLHYCLLLDRLRRNSAHLIGRHPKFSPAGTTQISTRPSNACFTGPVSHIGSPGPCQCTLNVPPGTRTSTSAPSSPRLRPTATAAQAPVPQARVSPTPRSNTRRPIRPASFICMKPTLT